MMVLLGLALGGAYLHFAPPAYYSLGRMIVSIKLSIPESTTYSEELNNFLGTQTALMQSDVVQARAHAALTATNSSWTNRRARLAVSLVPKTSIFNLRGTGQDPDYVQAFVQACMNEYAKLKKEMVLQTSDTTRDSLTAEISRLQEDLQGAEQALASFQATNSIVFLQDMGYSAMFDLLIGFYRQLEGLTSEHQLLEKLGLEQNLERERQLAIATMLGTAQPSGTGAGASLYASELELIKCKQQMVLLKAQQQEMSAELKPMHPAMLGLQEETARQERLLEIYRGQSQDDLDNKKRSLALQMEDLKRAIKDWEVRALETGRQKTAYERLKSEHARTQALYDRMTDTVRSLDMNKGIRPESVTSMQDATPPLPDRLGHLLVLCAAAFGGLVVGVLLLFFVEQLDDRMMSFLELQESFEEELIGQIPKERKDRGETSLAMLQPNDARHSFVEAFRSFRSALLFISKSEPPPRVLLVTSSVPNDGKSVVSANLALTMAYAGSRVLLVDADLRKGDQHRSFTLEPEPGLANVLADGLRPSEAIKPTSVANLHLLPRGTMSPRSSELFLRESIDKLIQEFRSQYDYVVLDSPPVMAADDASCLAPHVDGVCFVIRAEHTSARVARAALDVLYQRKVPILGLVFNAVRTSSSEYYYYGYKDYYAKP
jgi:capsular exopolysaccharide synthesis family protein